MDITETLQDVGNTAEPLAWRKLKVLSNLGPEVQPALDAAWRQIEAGRRQEISSALVSLAEDQIEFNFQEFFLAVLDDPEAAVRVSALNGLWENNGSQLLRRMIAMLAADPSGEVRAAAALGLGRYLHLGELEEVPVANAQAARDALYAAASDQEQALEVRRRAIESLGYRGAEPPIEELIAEAYDDQEQLMRESAVAAMGRSMQERWLGDIARELASNSPALRYEAARAVGEMSDAATPLLSQLLPLVDDDDTEVYLAAIWALGQVGGPHAKRVLQRVARSKNEGRSQAATDALEELTLGEE